MATEHIAKQKTYRLELSVEQAEMLDISLSLAVKHAPSGSPRYRLLQREIGRQFEAQD